MKFVTLTMLAVLLTACGSFNAVEMGQRAREVEEALCPLQTAQNVDATIDNLLSLVPIIVWDPVCQIDE
jgi:hypothetical protein